MLSRLEAATHRLPELLAQVRRADARLPPSTLLEEGPVLSTGIGLAGGPARLFSIRASSLGHASRFLCLSEVAQTRPVGKTLVLFSQSFSRNARLARRVHAPQRVVFTGVLPEAQTPTGTALSAFLGPHGHHVRVPAEESHGRMVRFHGPATSAYAGLRWLSSAHPEIGWLSTLDQVPEAAAAALTDEHGCRGGDVARACLKTPVAFISSGQNPAELHQLAWKWAESLFLGPPRIIDALELAHGPLQAFYEREMVFLALRGPGQAGIFERVESVMHPRRHRLVFLDARLPDPMSLFEYDARINALILEALAQNPERLEAWPARGLDGPLYDYEG